MIAGSSHPRQLFSMDTAQILKKRETSLNHFISSVDKYNSYKVNILLIKLISWYCCFDLGKFSQSLLKPESCCSFNILYMLEGELMHWNKSTVTSGCLEILMAKWCVSCVYANFFHFYLGIFHLKVFCVLKCPFKLSK